MAGMHIVVLAGGIGGARFLLGVRAVARDAGARVTAVVNVGDDVTVHGLRVCPDLDSVMYTLGGGADPERGWGRRDETWVVKEELAAYGAEPTWFGLGDRGGAPHLVRTRMLDAGSSPSRHCGTRWSPGPPRWSASPPSSAARRCVAWPTSAWPRSASSARRPAWAACTEPGARAASSTGGSWTTPTKGPQWTV